VGSNLIHRKKIHPAGLALIAKRPLALAVGARATNEPVGKKLIDLGIEKLLARFLRE